MMQTAFTFACYKATNGKALGEAGMNEVLAKEIEAWKILAEDRVLKLAASGIMFTIEDVYDAVGRPPRHFNSAGALLGNLAKAGKIQATGQVMSSSAPSRHNSLVRFWKGVA